ncbi:MAG: AHH domain-containing protein [Phycisphaerales bacterium]|nr:AHH domain-containing protein [Phycisphaerales bacterium]
MRQPLVWREMDQQGNVTSETHPSTEVDYAKHRWVVIIDEFPTWEDARNAEPAEITTASGSKTSFFKTMLGRRVVGMNPQGNVLWEKTFTLRNEQFVEGGDTGLNESYVYISGKQLIESVAPTVDASKLEASVATERFLVQKRSVGWSAAELAEVAPDAAPTDQRRVAGLVWNYHYADVSSTPKPIDADGNPVPGALSWGERLRPVGESIQNGNAVSDGPTIPYDSESLRWTSQTFYKASDPTVVLGSAQFTAPRATPFPATSGDGGLATALQSSDAIVTRAVTRRFPDNQTGPYEKIVTMSISPPRQSRLGGPLLHDVNLSISNSKGLTVWSVSAFLPVSGTVPDPMTLSAGSDPDARVQLTYHRYDNYGRNVETIVDVARSSDGVDEDDLLLLPDDLDRLTCKGGPPPAAYRTVRRYSDEDGLMDVIQPNGKRWARRIVPGYHNDDPAFNKGNPFDRMFTFNDLLPEGGETSWYLPTGTFKAAGIAYTKDYDSYVPPSRFLSRSSQGGISGGQVLREDQARVLSTVELTEKSLESLPDLEPLAQTRMSYDSAGRPVAAKSLERTATGLAASSADVRDDGDRVTTTEWDGTLTRRIRNARGQLVRTYIGTNATNASIDWNSQWPTNQSPDPTETGVEGFDMLLRERVEYGSDPTNALQPIRKWTYVENPPWDTEQLAAFGHAPAGDGHGELTHTHYDWRMRPVRVDVRGPKPSGNRPFVSSRVTFLDHADRPVLEATYTGAAPPPSFDPSVAPPFAAAPSVAALLAAPIAPTSLTETRYFSDGTVKERLTYRTPGPGYAYAGSPQFHTERFFYGVGGKQTFAERPESPIQITVLDNMGRQIREVTVCPRTVSNTTRFDFELTRTDYRFDSEGNIVLTDRWERLAAPTSAADLAVSGAQALSSANAALTRTQTWYDHAKRVLTVREWGDDAAAFGTQTFSALDAVVHSSNPNQAPRMSVDLTANPPTVSILSAVSNAPGRWTYHAYDTSGLKIATRAPDGKLSTFSYDTKGQLIREVANAADPDPAQSTHTRHAYWLGRPISTSTVRTANNEQTRQFQGVAYGAQVVRVKRVSVDHDRDGRGHIPDVNQGTFDIQVDGFEYISNSNALVGAMMSCNPDLTPLDGYTVDTVPANPVAEQLKDYIQSIQDFQFARPDFAYRYYADGLIAERVDKRGVAIRYFYDSQRRLQEQEVWNYSRPTYTTGEVPANAPVPQPTDRNIWRLEDAVPGYPTWMGLPKANNGVDEPVDRIGYIAYSYDSRGNLERVKAGTTRAAVGANPPAIVAETKYVYDDRNNLIKEIQSHGGSADIAGVPFIEYARQYTTGSSSASSFVAGRDRLISMTYPGQAGYTGPRTVTFDYGNVAGLDSLIDRPSLYRMGASRVASFTYTGSGRRVSTALGGTAASPWVTQTFDTNPAATGLEGLDAMGRVRDLHFRTVPVAPASPSTLWRGQYGYDINGNRLFERLTQRAPSQATVGAMPGVGGDNTRSRRFFYDDMDRLKSAESGALSADNLTIGASAAYPGLGAGALPTGRRRESWGLDKLGNWSANNLDHEYKYNVCGIFLPTGTIQGYGPGDKTLLPPPPPGPGGLTIPRPAGHRVEIVDSADAAANVSYKAHLTADFDPAAGHEQQRALNAVRWMYERSATGEDVWTRCITDANGNLVFDGKQFYQYDAWNRLIQVNDASAMRWWAFHDQGVKMGTPYLPNMAQLPTFCESPVIGWMLKHFNYDGVGRLYRTSSRLDPSLLAEGYAFAGGGVANRSERIFYDGTRRIQEVVTDPVVVTNSNGDVATMVEENEQRGGGGGGGGGAGGGGGQQSGPQMTVSFLRATYIWGPGDSPTSGVDELLVQIDPSFTTGSVGSVPDMGGKPWYAIGDAQGDLVALLHNASATSTAEVAAQWTYSPYGEVLTYERFHPHPVVVFGHKSLVIDRLDAPALSWDTGTSSLSDTQRLIPGATLLAYARNRTYSPGLGRWLQQDPNDSGSPVSGRHLLHAAKIDEYFVSVSLIGRTTDGLSLAASYRSNPIMVSDSLGLFGLPAVGVGVGIGVGLLVPGPSDFITGMLESLTTEYAARQEWDVEWAMDWRMSDDSHSRMDSTWVGMALGWGIYNSFEIGFGEYTTNPIDWFASSAGASDVPLPAQNHHIMTNKNSKAGLRWTEKYKLLFKDHGIKGNPFEWEENKVKLPGHKGRHPDSYHMDVYKDVRADLESVQDPKLKEKALRDSLDRWKTKLLKDGAAAHGLDRPARKPRR